MAEENAWAYLLQPKHWYLKCLLNRQWQKTLDPTKEVYIHRWRRTCNEVVGGEVLWYSQILYRLGGQPTNWKILYHRVSLIGLSAESHGRLSSLGVWRWEEEAPELSASKASGAQVQELQGLGEERLHSWRVPVRFHVHWDPGKAVTPRESGPDIFVGCGGAPGEAGLAAAHCGGKNRSGRGSGGYSSVWALSEATILALRSDPTQEPAASSAGLPQARQPTQTHHLSARGCPKSPWVHSALSTHPPTWPWPQRDTRSSTDQGAGISLSHQEACKSP